MYYSDILIFAMEEEKNRKQNLINKSIFIDNKSIINC